MSVDAATIPRCYLDHAASAPVSEVAREAIIRGMRLVGNPSAQHACGLAARDALETARAQVARLFGAQDDEIVFTSGGSESLSLAIQGVLGGTPGHVVVTAIEHSAVLENVRVMAARTGTGISYIPAGRQGHVRVEDVLAQVRDTTRLVCMMHANNETGAVQPVEELGEALANHPATFLVDAVQTAGKLPLNALGADLVAISGHKFGGGRGAGALYVRRGHHLLPLVLGGRQEQQLRAGTENVPALMGMGAAAEERRVSMQHGSERAQLARLRQAWEANLLVSEEITSTVPAGPCLSEILSVRFSGIRADTLADRLDLSGISVATGSACHAGDGAVSHVLSAMGLTETEARSTVRISFGPELDPEHVVRVSLLLREQHRHLLEMSGTRRITHTC